MTQFKWLVAVSTCAVLLLTLILPNSAKNTASATAGLAEIHELTRGEIQKHRVTILEGQDKLIEIRQLGVDIRTSVRISTGETVISNSPGERNSTEFLFFSGSNPGIFNIEVSPLHDWWQGGQYSYKEWTGSFNKLEIGLAHLGHEDSKLREDTAEQIDLLVNGRSDLVSINEDNHLALAHYFIADIYRQNHRYGRSIKNYRAASKIWRALGDQEMRLAADRGAAFSQVRIHEFDSARKAYEEIDSELETISYKGSIFDQLMVRSNRCWVHSEADDYELAQECLALLTPTLTSVADYEFVGLVNNNYAFVLLRLGRAREALVHFSAAIENYERVGSLSRISSTLGSMAMAYRSLGQISDAIQHYSEALELSKQKKNRRRSSRLLSNLGQLYAFIGNYSRATDYLELALPVRKDTKDYSGYRATLHNLANAYRASGRIDKALEYRDRLLADESPGFSKAERVTYLLGKAGDLLAANDQEEFVHIDDQLVSAAREIKQPALLAQIKLKRARIKHRMKKFDEALAMANSARNSFKGIESIAMEFEVLTFMAEIHALKGELNASIAHGQDAIALAERVRSTIEFDSLGPTFTSTVHDAYANLARAMVEKSKKERRLHWIDESLIVVQRLKSRALNDYRNRMIMSGSNITGKDLQRLDSLHQNALSLEHALRHSARTPKTRDHFRELSVEYQSAIIALENEQRKLRRESSTGSDERTFSLKALQKKLGRGDVVLEFILAEPQSLVWRIDQDSVRTYEVSSRKVIDTLTNELFEQIENDKTISSSVRLQLADRLRLEDLMLSDAARIYLSTHGSSGQIPFSALFIEDADKNPILLADCCQIINLPSISAWLNSESSGPKKRIFDRELAIIADPVFDSFDPRVENPGNGGRKTRPNALNSYQPRLLWSRYEADRVVGLFDAETVTKFYDFDANLDAIRSPEFLNARRIHISSHSVVDKDRTELTGMLLTQMTADGIEIDGLLSPLRIMQSMISAETVVLSGCETAVGPFHNGEGMQSVTTAFLKRGAQSVIASKWRVPDRSTALFMESFYGFLASGFDAAEALKKSKTDFSNSREYDNPYFWAGFSLYSL